MTHAVVGVTLGTLAPFPRRRLFWVASAVIPMVPDFDVIGLPLGVLFLSMWGHRGISHSLFGALVLGLGAAGLAARVLGARRLPLTLYFAAITATHGVLDALTTGGPGVAFFAPFDDTRYFFPWRPIPVSPLPRHFFTAWGWYVVRSEMALVWVPSLAIALIGLRRRRA